MNPGPPGRALEEAAEAAAFDLYAAGPWGDFIGVGSEYGHIAATNSHSIGVYREMVQTAVASWLDSLLRELPEEAVEAHARTLAAVAHRRNKAVGYDDENAELSWRVFTLAAQSDIQRVLRSLRASVEGAG